MFSYAFILWFSGFLVSRLFLMSSYKRSIYWYSVTCKLSVRFQEEGNIDRFDRRESEAKNEALRYVDLDSVEHTDVRNVGAE